MPKLHHDYYLPGLYWLSLSTAGHYPHLGFLALDADPHIEKSKLASDISHYLHRRLPGHYPNLIISHLAISPASLHLILDVHRPFRDGGHLGKVMTSVRKWCNTMYWDTYAPHGTQLFENGYRDQPLDEPLLDHWRNYLDYEPRRLSFISTNPEFFTCVHELSCAGAQYLCLGNPFLLDIPLKQTVIASDTENQRQFQPKWNQYMECGACGGVLISAATTSRERAVMSQALERKYNIIWIRESDAQPRFPLFSPAHNACQRGNLLLLSPMGFSGIRNLLTPEQRTYLNNLATELSAPALSYQLHQGFESGFVHIPPTCVTVCGVDEGQA